jgi:hypothetical protein
VLRFAIQFWHKTGTFFLGHDGCCVCRRRLLSRLLAGGATTAKASQCREMPRLYGPGLRLVRPAASPVEDNPKGKS